MRLASLTAASAVNVHESTSVQVAPGPSAASTLTRIALPAPTAEQTAAMSLRDRFRLALSVTTSVAAPFHFRGELAHTAAAHGTDANCLAQAVYYEARGESASGQAAVAQVVLNRVRHPAFPKTVCGVVFQKSGQGCQFSFACNGSMHNGMEAGAWRRAQQVAQRALGGAVMADVGQATQFQAVRAGWASGLLKVAQIGEHAFYRLAGHQGSAGMFHDRAEPSAPREAVAEVRVASLSPAATAKAAELGQNAPVQSVSNKSASIQGASTPSASATSPQPAAAIAPKPATEPAPAMKTAAPAVTSVKTEDASPKPMTTASAGA